MSKTFKDNRLFTNHRFYENRAKKWMKKRISARINRIDDKMKILNINPYDKLLYILQLAEEKLQDKIDEQKMVDDMHQEYLKEQAKKEGEL